MLMFGPQMKKFDIQKFLRILDYSLFLFININLTKRQKKRYKVKF